MQDFDPQQYLKDAELLHSDLEVQLALSNIAAQLNRDYASESPIVLCVMGGGVIFTGMLLPKLLFPLEFDYVQASRYHGATVGQNLEWVIKPKQSIKNRTVLILDDILDEGVTMRAIVDECKQLGAKSVKVAVLADKALSQSKPIFADYIGLTVPNRYVFGCGMDVYGWWRNLSAIYALPDGK